MRVLVLGLVLALAAVSFSKSDEDFLREFKISDKSVAYYEEAVKSESMNAEIKDIKKLFKKYLNIILKKSKNSKFKNKKPQKTLSNKANQCCTKMHNTIH